MKQFPIKGPKIYKGEEIYPELCRRNYFESIFAKVWLDPIDRFAIKNNLPPLKPWRQVTIYSRENGVKLGYMMPSQDDFCLGWMYNNPKLPAEPGYWMISICNMHHQQVLNPKVLAVHWHYKGDENGRRMIMPWFYEQAYPGSWNPVFGDEGEVISDGQN